jgi:hypothetical protein
MDLHEDPELILAYVEDELPEAQARAFESRCAADPALATLVRELRADRAALRALPAEPVDVAGSPDLPSSAALAQMERRLLLDDAPVDTAAVAGDRKPTTGSVYRILRYASYTGVAAAIALTGVLVVDNLTGTPLEQRGRDLAQRTTVDPATEADASASGAASGPSVRAEDSVLAITSESEATEAMGDAVAGTLSESAADSLAADLSAGQVTRREAVAPSAVLPPSAAERGSARGNKLAMSPAAALPVPMLPPAEADAPARTRGGLGRIAGAVQADHLSVEANAAMALADADPDLGAGQRLARADQVTRDEALLEDPMLTRRSRMGARRLQTPIMTNTWPMPELAAAGEPSVAAESAEPADSAAGPLSDSRMSRPDAPQQRLFHPADPIIRPLSVPASTAAPNASDPRGVQPSEISPVPWAVDPAAWLDAAYWLPAEWQSAEPTVKKPTP